MGRPFSFLSLDPGPKGVPKPLKLCREAIWQVSEDPYHTEFVENSLIFFCEWPVYVQFLEMLSHLRILVSLVIKGCLLYEGSPHLHHLGSYWHSAGITIHCAHHVREFCGYSSISYTFDCEFYQILQTRDMISRFLWGDHQEESDGRCRRMCA